MNLHLFTLNLICYLRAELLHLEYITEHDTSQFMEAHIKGRPEQENITYLPHKVYKKNHLYERTHTSENAGFADQKFSKRMKVGMHPVY